MFWWKRRGRLSANELSGRLRRVLDQVDVNYSGQLKISRHVQLETLRFPLDFAGRIAILDSGFQSGGNMREFTDPDVRWLRQYAPEAIVCPLDVALSLADQKIRGLIELPSLTIALVVTTKFDDSPLEDHHRDLLWRAFGVPVFEQLRGPDGKVLVPVQKLDGFLPSTLPVKAFPRNARKERHDGNVDFQDGLYESPSEFDKFTLQDAYRIEKEGDYTLTVCCAIYVLPYNGHPPANVDYDKYQPIFPK